jgi:LmbE family N-acetylglucosaminyl deacetylase
MLPLTLGRSTRGPLTVLCLGAHSDDIEIGCGGTILRLLAERRRVAVHWIVLSGDARRAREARRSATRLLRGASAREVLVLQFRDGFLPYQGAAVKDAFEQLKQNISPDLIFTHHGADAHQDHRLVSELTWNTFRDHTILEYEIPKYDGDLGRPNVFVPLGPRFRERKLSLLMSAFPSQRGKRWFTRETFDAMMRLRGIECSAPGGYAEAFHCRKIVLAAGAVWR